MAAKRRRGRPPGSGKNDAPHLAQVADRIVAAPDLKPTTAMKHIIATRKWEERDEALLRRWQGKWKEHKVELLAAAKERAKPKPVHIGGYASNQLALQASLGAVHALHDLQSPISKTLRMIAENSKWMKHVMNIHNQVREFQKLQGQASSFTHQFWEQEKMIRTASACLTGSLK